MGQLFRSQIFDFFFHLRVKVLVAFFARGLNAVQSHVHVAISLHIQSRDKCCARKTVTVVVKMTGILLLSYSVNYFINNPLSPIKEYTLHLTKILILTL